MAEPAPWTCPTCKTGVLTPFCPLCGEEPLKPIDLTLRGLAEKLSHALTSIDARVLRTARLLILRPGELTLAWTEGRRKPYVAPFQLFLVANVIFFFLQSLTGINVFSSNLHSHLHQQDWSELAQSLLSSRLEVTGTSIDTYAPIFDRAVVLNAKSLIVVMAVPFSALLPLVFLRKRQPFMLHLVFSLHVYTFLLLVFCLALLAAKACEWSGIGGLDTPAVDNVLSVANLAACALYLYVAIGRVYGARGAMRVVQAIVLALAVGVIALGYRFALFLITLYGT
ncbi:DUF3667 domain-containing protein [Variovorax sp. Sphag1AA]|uniref:DUF3667 domain-containing protein n=1 Tax=Variovorax sp. Sphag1AA TaxID=2587027 RepID=UPI001609989D|nr:DUF3667 domain-containing protein [Variovorax sp. Sphag1AA]MBB3181779.1 hypothetical protein [Variovorax sp. Sphag1AA]